MELPDYFRPIFSLFFPRLLPSPPPPPSFYHFSFCLPFFLPLFSFLTFFPCPLFCIFFNSQYTLTVWNFLSGEKVSTKEEKPCPFFSTQLSATRHRDKSPPSWKCITVPPGTRVNSLWQSTEKDWSLAITIITDYVVACCGVDICIFLTRYGVDIDIDEVSESLNSDPRLHRMWINNNMQIIYDMLERSRKFKR